FWQFSMTGLPQMLMLFIFSLAVYCLVRAVELRAGATAGEVEAGEVPAPDAEVEPPAEVASPGLLGRIAGSTFVWLGGASLCFGVLALTHALTIFIFVGALIFSAIYFRPFWKHFGLMLGIFVLAYSPWMIRNYQVCGSPVG